LLMKVTRRMERQGEPSSIGQRTMENTCPVSGTDFTPAIRALRV